MTMTIKKLLLSICLILSSSMITNLLGQDISKEPEVFKVVEEMPMFPGCENKDISQEEKYDCGKDKMIDFISEHLEYPKLAKDKDVEGMCVVQFIVGKEGSLSDIKLVRDIGDGCGQASLDVIHKMNELDIKWISGKQRGKSVEVLMTVPIKFVIPKD